MEDAAARRDQHSLGPETPMVAIERARDEDLPLVMATERLPGYALLVGRWEESVHRQAMADRRHAYFIGYESGLMIGFPILRDWNTPELVTLIKRIAVIRPGYGQGRGLMRALVNAAFSRTEVHRLSLGVFVENVRARRAYEAVGFIAEGIERGSAYFDGRYRDQLVMSLLRPEWKSGDAGRSVRLH